MSAQATHNMASGHNDYNQPYGYPQELNDLESVLGVRALTYYDLGPDQNGIWAARVCAIYGTNGYACMGHGPTQAAAKEHAARQVLALTPWCPHTTNQSDIEALINETNELRAKNAKLEKSNQDWSTLVDKFMVENTEAETANDNKIKALEEQNKSLRLSLENNTRDYEREQKALREELRILNMKYQHQLRNNEGTRRAARINLQDIREKEEMIVQLRSETISKNTRLFDLGTELIRKNNKIFRLGRELEVIENDAQALEQKVAAMIEYDEECTRKAQDNKLATQRVLNDMDRAIKKIRQEVAEHNGLKEIMGEELEGARELISTLKLKNRILEEEYHKEYADARNSKRELDYLRLSDDGELYRRIHEMQQEVHAADQLREKEANEHTAEEGRLQRRLEREKDRKEHLERIIDDKDRTITAMSDENRRLRRRNGRIRVIRMRPVVRQVVIGEDHDWHDLQRLGAQTLRF